MFYVFDYRPGYASSGHSTATSATFDPFAFGFQGTLNVNLPLQDMDTNASPQLGMTLRYQYNVSDLFAPDNLNLQKIKDPNGGQYVEIDGKDVPYDATKHQNLDRYNIKVTGVGTGIDMDDYLKGYVKDKVLKDLADATWISLKSDQYAIGTVHAKENENHAMTAQYDTPYQLVSSKGWMGSRREEEEYLNIQCSSNTIDYISIKKQKLSIYRMGLHKFQTLTQDQARKGIDLISDALKTVNTVRSRFGAYQNRLEHAYAINRNTHENTQSAESVIRDTNMTEMMVQHSNNNILHQSANSMLAQANQTNRAVLALLQ